jgi:hypothetical protein
VTIRKLLGSSSGSAIGFCWDRLGTTACGLVFLATAICAPLLAMAGARNADQRNPQCWDCIQHITMELPVVNAQEDPNYEHGLTPGSVLPALSQCSLDDGEIPRLQEIIRIFTDALVNGGGVAYVRDNLGQVAQLTSEDRARLVDGAAQSLDSALRHLIDHNCRILLKSHFDEGASRGWMLAMIDLGRKASDIH